MRKSSQLFSCNKRAGKRPNNQQLCFGPYHSGGVDVVGVGGVHQRIQDHPVVVVGQLVRVAVLLLVLGLEGHGRGAGLGLVAAKADPLLFQPLLVLQVVLHVGEDHVASGDVHAVCGGLVGPVERTKVINWPFFPTKLLPR